MEADRLSNDGFPYLLTYSMTTTNGVTTKTIDINTNRGTQSAKASVSTIKTEYITKDIAGNETFLAEYEETGR